MNDEQLKILKKQTFFMKMTMIFMGGVFLIMLIASLSLVPNANRVMNNAVKTLDEVNVAVEELNKTASQLSEIDFKGLVDNTQQMVNDGSAGIEQAIGKINEMDIEGLNNAIGDLEAIVAPLAKLFGKR